MLVCDPHHLGRNIGIRSHRWIQSSCGCSNGCPAIWDQLDDDMGGKKAYLAVLTGAGSVVGVAEVVGLSGRLLGRHDVRPEV